MTTPTPEELERVATEYDVWADKFRQIANCCTEVAAALRADNGPLQVGVLLRLDSINIPTDVPNRIN